MLCACVNELLREDVTKDKKKRKQGFSNSDEVVTEKHETSQKHAFSFLHVSKSANISEKSEIEKNGKQFAHQSIFTNDTFQKAKKN